MRLYRTCMVILLVATFLSIVNAQDSHVNSVYVEKDKRTVISTDQMYVVNEPNQFIQMTLSFRYSGKQMTKVPDKVGISIWSLTKEPLYRKDTDRKLYMVASGERFESSPTTYLVLKGETFKGQDTFFSENRPGLGLQISLPQNAQVKSGGVNGLFMEQLYTDIKSKDLVRIVDAKDVEVFLGKQKLNLSESQMNTLREFARRLNP